VEPSRRRTTNFAARAPQPPPPVFTLYAADTLKRLRVLKRKIVARNQLGGQTDAASLRGHPRTFLSINDHLLDYSLLGGKIDRDRMLRERCKLICLKQLMAKDFRSLVSCVLEPTR